jgi:hypothetical protein
MLLVQFVCMYAGDSRPKPAQWLQHREQHSYKTTQHTVIKYLIRSTYTHAKEDFWPQGLQKQWSEQLNMYIKGNPLWKAYPSI